MKKLLGIALLSLVVLTACGSDETDGAASGATVCRLEVMGEQTTTTIHEENGYVTSFTVESSQDVSDLSTDDIEFSIEMTRAMMGDMLDIEHTGNRIITLMTITAEDMGETAPVEELIAELEAAGATCN